MRIAKRPTSQPGILQNCSRPLFSTGIEHDGCENASFQEEQYISYKSSNYMLIPPYLTRKALKALRLLPDRHVLEMRIIPQLAILINLGGLIGGRDPSFFILLDFISGNTSLISGQP